MSGDIREGQGSRCISERVENKAGPNIWGSCQEGGKENWLMLNQSRAHFTGLSLATTLATHFTLLHKNTIFTNTFAAQISRLIRCLNTSHLLPLILRNMMFDVRLQVKSENSHCVFTAVALDSCPSWCRCVERPSTASRQITIFFAAVIYNSYIAWEIDYSIIPGGVCFENGQIERLHSTTIRVECSNSGWQGHGSLAVEGIYYRMYRNRQANRLLSTYLFNVISLSRY